MTPEQFCYWLQGRAEMQPNNPPSAEEWTMICEHLQLVFKKETLPAFVPQLPPVSMKSFGKSLQINPFETPQCGIGMAQGTPQFGRNQPNIC